MSELERALAENFSAAGRLLGEVVSSSGIGPEAFKKILMSVSTLENEFRTTGETGHAHLCRGFLDGLTGKRSPGNG